MKIKEFLKTSKPVIVLLVICLVISAALAGVNMITREPIARAQEQARLDALETVMPGCEYEEKGHPNPEWSYTLAKKDGEIKGYIFETSAKGYGGECVVMTAVDPDGKIINVAMIDISSETVGLGQNANNENFKAQFKDKSGELSVGKDIDALTGATITSRAVVDAVNEALERFASLDYNDLGGGK